MQGWIWITNCRRAMGMKPRSRRRRRESSGSESELQKLKAERDSLLDRLARAQAEFENARRRAIKEQQDFRDYAVADAIKSLLPVIDSLERALQVKSDAAEFRGGVELIYKQLQAALAKLSVHPIVSKGEAFDPQLPRGHRNGGNHRRPRSSGTGGVAARLQVQRPPAAARDGEGGEEIPEGKFLSRERFTSSYNIVFLITERRLFWPRTQNAIITKYWREPHGDRS